MIVTGYLKRQGAGTKIRNQGDIPADVQKPGPEVREWNMIV